ncbi:MAG TPA: hypothetical protein VMU32_06675 [Solirubrobacteraceae bacterium]|nr:hypothetical protein [Solirubrobacteraceae bacterium]
MPQTKTQRSRTADKGTSAHERSTTSAHERSTNAGKHEHPRALDRTTDLSDEVLKSLESGQRAAIDAVRRFVDTVDQTLPALGERPSRRQEIIDAAMEMADRLVHTEYDFLRNVVQSAGKALSRQDDAK